MNHHDTPSDLELALETLEDLEPNDEAVAVLRGGPRTTAWTGLLDATPARAC